MKNWFFCVFSSKYDPMIKFLRFFCDHRIKNTKSLPKIKNVIFHLFTPSGELNFSEIFDFFQFFRNLTPKKIFFHNFFVRLPWLSNIKYFHAKNFSWNRIFTKCHAFYEFKIDEKLQSEIWCRIFFLKFFWIRWLFGVKLRIPETQF